MPLEDARHLLLRAGLGPTPYTVDEMLPLSVAQAVDQLLQSPDDQLAAPSFVDDPWISPPIVRAMGKEERKVFNKKRRKQVGQLQAWWLNQMVTTRSPLHERMVLFWHGHFTSSAQRVRNPQLMYRQHQLFRRHALGNFADLLRAIARDPAMLVYLDNRQNRKGRPNENFARELLELFTLGEGHYSEQDIKEAARAFTGWSIDRDTGRFHVKVRQHDAGLKSFLGVSGRLNGDDIVERLLAHPRTAEHLVAKLWVAFISPTPDTQLVSRWAGQWRNEGYEIKPLLRRMLTSKPFLAPANRGVLVKSPVDLIVGSLRLLDRPVLEAKHLLRSAQAQGQQLLKPPNVKGWPDGVDWIDANRLLARHGFSQRLMRGKEMRKGRMMGGMRTDAVVNMVQAYGIEGVQQRVMAVEPVIGETKGNARQRLLALMLDPAWQLK